ncbi:MAG: hypothetical protein CVU46_10685 [Chloroflexi bacterium HGW-Chloroflexi-8]|jgi:hypothetical protein|nr:MAG: hypothetical protein CVU46_10685 [Chloroflexi bacterium HGW-Chloroflexi-8]
MIRKFRIILIIFFLFIGGCSEGPDDSGIFTKTKETPILSTEMQVVVSKTSTALVQISTSTRKITPNPVISPFPKEVAPVRSETPFIFELTTGVHNFFPLVQSPFGSTYLQTIDNSYPYGSTQNNERVAHDGVEIYNAHGTPVLAAQSGTVFFAGNDLEKQWGRYKNFYGNMIILRHNNSTTGDQFFTLYAHLSEILVKENQIVNIGQQIGKVGDSGGATGSHLHFEIRVNQPLLENTINPELYLDFNYSEDRNKSGFLTGQVIDQNGNYLSENPISIQPLIGEEIDQTKIPRFIQTYTAGMPEISYWKENFALRNLPAGDYRVSTYTNGIFLEKFITIEPGMLTYLILQPE